MLGLQAIYFGFIPTFVQVWCADITYIPVNLVAIMGHTSWSRLAAGADAAHPVGFERCVVSLRHTHRPLGAVGLSWRLAGQREWGRSVL